MAEAEGLMGLRELHQDLVALEETRLVNIDRLWAELEARVNEFRQLLDKPGKADSSRKSLQSGRQYFKLVHSVTELSLILLYSRYHRCRPGRILRE